MVQATMSVYKSAVSIFLPTPSKSHYVFNLRDFARVVRGVLLVPKTNMKEGDKLIRLWVHEVYRVFYDRLIDDDDRYVSLFRTLLLLLFVFHRQRFFEIVCNETQQHFKTSLDKLLKDLTTSGTLIDDNIRGLFFGDYMIPGVEPRIYDQVTDFEELTSTIEKYVFNYVCM